MEWEREEDGTENGSGEGGKETSIAGRRCHKKVVGGPRNAEVDTLGTRGGEETACQKRVEDLGRRGTVARWSPLETWEEGGRKTTTARELLAAFTDWLVAAVAQVGSECAGQVALQLSGFAASGCCGCSGRSGCSGGWGGGARLPSCGHQLEPGTDEMMKWIWTYFAYLTVIVRWLLNAVQLCFQQPRICSSFRNLKRPASRGRITVFISTLIHQSDVVSSNPHPTATRAGCQRQLIPRELFNAVAFEASLCISWLLSRRATRSLHAPSKQPAIRTKRLASSITRPSRQGTCQTASIRHPGKDCHGTILTE